MSYFAYRILIRETFSADESKELIECIEKRYGEEIQCLEYASRNYSFFLSNGREYQNWLSQNKEKLAKIKYQAGLESLSDDGSLESFCEYRFKQITVCFVETGTPYCSRVKKGTGLLNNGKHINLIYYYKDIPDREGKLRRLYLILPDNILKKSR